MKTLDEVINVFEKRCCQGCDKCPYFADNCLSYLDEPLKDALHYLKEYKTNQEDPDGDHQQLEKCRALLQDFYRNDPLSWDELKAMTGKPVWVEALLYKQWAVIGYVGENYIRFEGVNLYAPESRTYMGAEDGWQAYRKERK